MSTIAAARLACLWVLLYNEIGGNSHLALLPLVLVNYPELALYHQLRHVAAPAYGSGDVVLVSMMVLFGSIILTFIALLPILIVGIFRSRK